jgi:hypothetical protein
MGTAPGQMKSAHFAQRSSVCGVLAIFSSDLFFFFFLEIDFLLPLKPSAAFHSTNSVAFVTNSRQVTEQNQKGPPVKGFSSLFVFGDNYLEEAAKAPGGPFKRPERERE